MNALHREAYPRVGVHALVVLSALMALAGAHICRHYVPAWAQEDAALEESRALVVELEGAGVRRGVYFFSNAPTVAEACARAGVPRDAAMAHADEVVASGALLRLSEAGLGFRVEQRKMEAATRLLFGIPLDLNEVSAHDLAQIPGIGPRLAEAVIEYRSTHGPFKAVGALEEVRGIGEKTLASIRKQVVVKR